MTGSPHPTTSAGGEGGSSGSQLERSVQRLIDVEDIKVLKLTYARSCDDDYDAAAIASCFTHDGVWDGGPLGRAEGRDGIRRFFESAKDRVEFAIHYTTNPLIEIDGDHATGRWHLWQPMVTAPSGQSTWLAALYDETYVRVKDRWLIQRLKIDIRSLAPADAGAGFTRFADTRQGPPATTGEQIG